MRGELRSISRCCMTTALLTMVLLAALLNAHSGAAAGARPGAAAKAAEEPVYIPAGVSDVGGAVGCLRTPAGGVEAVDLAKGRSLWRSAAPARALLVARGRAFVLEERAGRQLRLAVYAERGGRLIRAYDLATLGLPPWASLSGAAEGREWTVFEVAARLAGDTIELRYDATRRQVSGFAAPGVIGRVQGAARIGIESGRIDQLPGPGPPAATAHRARGAAGGCALPGRPCPCPRRDARPWRAAAQRRRRAGRRGPEIRLRDGSGRQDGHRPSLEHVGGIRETPLRLEHGQATDAVWVTLDRRHVLLGRAYEQRWYDLYSLETGEPKGRLEHPADVAVVGPRIFWTTLESSGSLAFIATDAASGRTLWRRTVRDPEGPPGPPIP